MLILIFLLSLFGCQSSRGTVFTQNVMTIDYHITVGHPLNKAQIAQIQTTIEKTFNEINHIYNKWNPDSEISSLNRLKAYEQVTLSKELFLFFEKIDNLVTLSEGLFDPTVEPLIKLWKQKLEQNQIPSKAEINPIVPSIGWKKIHFDNGIFFKEHDHTEIDLGGVAKGFAVDLLIERLNEIGFSNLLVEWGGEMRASGEHPGHRPWTIFISNLGNPDPSQAITKIPLINQAIATSGDYYQFWFVNGDRYTHIYNPVTMEPIKNGKIESASVIANDCLTADALAKVLMLFEDETQLEQWTEKMKKQIAEFNYYIQYRLQF